MIFSLLHLVYEKLTEEKMAQAEGDLLNSELILFARSLEPLMKEAGLGKIWVQHPPESAAQGSVGLEKLIMATLDGIDHYPNRIIAATSHAYRLSGRQPP